MTTSTSDIERLGSEVEDFLSSMVVWLEKAGAELQGFDPEHDTESFGRWDNYLQQFEQCSAMFEHEMNRLLTDWARLSDRASDALRARVRVQADKVGELAAEVGALHDRAAKSSIARMENLRLSLATLHRGREDTHRYRLMDSDDATILDHKA